MMPTRARHCGTSSAAPDTTPRRSRTRWAAGSTLRWPWAGAAGPPASLATAHPGCATPAGATPCSCSPCRKRANKWLGRLSVMNPYSAKLGGSNSRGKPQVVAVEPWGSDYTLLPGEELSVVAFGDLAVPWFHIVEWDSTTQVYCEDTADFKVMQGDRELECRHNRQ